MAWSASGERRARRRVAREVDPLVGADADASAFVTRDGGAARSDFAEIIPPPKPGLPALSRS